jgi:hypothetical protein
MYFRLPPSGRHCEQEDLMAQQRTDLEPEFEDQYEYEGFSFDRD